MIHKLDALENKIAQVAALCRALRTENDRLLQQLATSEDEKKGLEERMEIARTRIEQLALKLPEAKAITA